MLHGNTEYNIDRIPALKATSRGIRNFKSLILKKLIKDLKDTMKKGELIGIAAPQIGQNYGESSVVPTWNVNDEYYLYKWGKGIKVK